jgi:hypothetical protein
MRNKYQLLRQWDVPMRIQNTYGCTVSKECPHAKLKGTAIQKTPAVETSHLKSPGFCPPHYTDSNPRLQVNILLTLQVSVYTTTHIPCFKASLRHFCVQYKNKSGDTTYIWSQTENANTL